MKKALLLVTIIFCLASCKKENTVVNTSLYGKWELAWVNGGLSPSRKIAAGNGNAYRFNMNGTYIKYTDNKVQAQGSYNITIDERRDTIEFGTINFTNPIYSDAWAKTPKTFTIGSSAADGPSYTYLKVQQ